MKKLPLLITVPHGGHEIPPEIRDIINIGHEEIFFDGDPYTREIYGLKHRVESFIESKTARAAVDMNRMPCRLPPDDLDGVIKQITIWEKEIYKKGMFPGKELIKELKQKYYFPFYEKISRALKGGRVKCGLDCHSMAASAPPVSDKPGEPRPVICLSDNDGTTCPPEYIRGLSAGFKKEFAEGGDVQINYPFKGGNIIKYNFEKHKVPWIQVEISRELYLRKPYFNRKTLEVDKARIRELNGKILKVFAEFAKNL